jgi:hypothetical protein
MSPGFMSSNSRGGSGFGVSQRLGTFTRHTQAPTFGRQFDRTLGQQHTRNKFVLVENEETGLVSVETTPAEVVTVTPGENGGLVVTVEPVEAEPEASPMPGEPLLLG